MAGSCEHGNEPSGSREGEEYLDQLIYYQSAGNSYRFTTRRRRHLICCKWRTFTVSPLRCYVTVSRNTLPQPLWADQ